MATPKQRDLVERVIKGTIRNTITWEEEGKDELSASVVLKYLESQRRAKIFLLKKEKAPYYRMAFNFEGDNSSKKCFFEVNSSGYQPLGRFGKYMFEIDP